MNLIGLLAIDYLSGDSIDMALDSAALGKLAETCTEDIDRCLDTRCAVEH